MKSVILALLAALLFPNANDPHEARADDVLASANELACSATHEVSLGFAGGHHIAFTSDEELAEDLDNLVDLGATWLRVDIDWALIEPNEGAQNWSRTDRLINAASARGINILALVTYAPRWAQHSSVPAGTTHGKPSSPAIFAEFAGDAAERYGEIVDAWEIWNEPNLASFFSPKPDAAYYADMVEASAAAIRSADPGSSIITGGLSPAINKADGSTIAPETYIEKLYQHIDRQSFDAIGAHPYSYPVLANEPGTEAWNSFIRLHLIRTLMINNGDAGKEIWITEFGAPTATVPFAGDQVVIDEELQSAIIASGLEMVAATGQLGPIFIYQIRDAAAAHSQIERSFGVVESNGRHKLSSDTLRCLMRDPVDVPPPPPPVTGS